MLAIHCSLFIILFKVQFRNCSYDHFSFRCGRGILYPEPFSEKETGRNLNGYGQSIINQFYQAWIFSFFLSEETEYFFVKAIMDPFIFK